MTLVEGRNRQIRKMMEGLGYKVVKLHRVEFMGIHLTGLRGPGDWAYLNEDEMKLSCGSRTFNGRAGVWLPADFCVVARVLLPQWLLCGVVPQPNLARDVP